MQFLLSILTDHCYVIRVFIPNTFGLNCLNILRDLQFETINQVYVISTFLIVQKSSLTVCFCFLHWRDILILKGKTWVISLSYNVFNSTYFNLQFTSDLFASTSFVCWCHHNICNRLNQYILIVSNNFKMKRFNSSRLEIKLINLTWPKLSFSKGIQLSSNALSNGR